MSESYIVLATNTNHDNFAYGPFSSYEDAKEAKFEMGGKDQSHEHLVLQLFDSDKPLPTVTAPLYERDMEKKVLRDLAVEEIGETPPFEPAEQPDAPEEEELDEDRNLDLGSAAAGEFQEEEEDDRNLTELRARAGELEIPGRSSMDRDELIAAIRAEEG